MTELLVHLAWVVASLVVLSAGAELLVRGSVSLAERLRVSSFVIGLTVVGFGTSTPELFTSIAAALRDSPDLAVGNVVGSNIFNVAFILGFTALIVPIPCDYRGMRTELVWTVVAALAVFVALATGGWLGRVPGALFLLALALYIGRAFRKGRRDAEEHAGRDVGHVLGLDHGPWGIASGLAFVATGLVLLVFGANLLVGSAIDLARDLGVSELAIALTVVAGGTSAPELFSSLIAGLRRQPELAVGNILGSNVFNILGILGSAAVITPQKVHAQVFGLDAPVMLAVSLLLFPLVRSQARIARVEGLLLLVLYVAYTWTLFTWAPGWFGARVGAVGD